MINHKAPKIIFLAVNASFSHTNLTALYFKEIAEKKGYPLEIIESTTAEQPLTLAIKLVEKKPDILCATFFLFNHLYLLSVLSRFKALLPEVIVLGGGPEFLGDNFSFLSKNRFISAVIRGESEKAFEMFLDCFWDKNLWRGIPGICYFLSEEYIDNGVAELDAIPILNYEKAFKSFNRPFLLVETSRGCRNNCSFCTSGKASKHIKTLELKEIKNIFTQLKKCGVNSIKLADRTFNDMPERYLPILKMMVDEFQDINFHLEIDPARVIPAFVEELSKAREKQFHLEVGIQSLNSEVLNAIGRQCTAARSISGLKALLTIKKHCIHTDLIAGLPLQTFESLLNDLELLTSLAPDHIQLELLKLLPGSRLTQEAKIFELIASPEPPYEVLRTSTMSEREIQDATYLSNLVDWYFNHPDMYELTILLAKTLPKFWHTFLNFYKERYFPVTAFNIEKRFHIIKEFLKNYASNQNWLLEQLNFFWLQAGLSLKGITNIEKWYGNIAPNAQLIKGSFKQGSINYMLRIGEETYIFSYHKAKKPIAIYRVLK